jgi:hypothetical protein
LGDEKTRGSGYRKRRAGSQRRRAQHIDCKPPIQAALVTVSA